MTKKESFDLTILSIPIAGSENNKTFAQSGSSFNQEMSKVKSLFVHCGKKRLSDEFKLLHKA